MLGHCFRCGWERTANNTAPESTLTKSCSYRFEPPHIPRIPFLGTWRSLNPLNCAQERLQSGDNEPRLNFKGKASQELLGNRDAASIDVARFIGAAIRKPRLSYQQKSARGNYATSFLYFGPSFSFYAFSAASSSSRVAALVKVSTPKTTTARVDPGSSPQ